MIIYFYNSSYNKVITGILTSIEANQVFLTLFLVFDTIKQNVTHNKRLFSFLLLTSIKLIMIYVEIPRIAR